MWTTLFEGFFSNWRNIVIIVLLLILCIVSILLEFNANQVTARDKTIAAQKTELQAQAAEIEARDARIAEYQGIIELAKEHQARVVVIEKQGAAVQAALNKMKISRELNDEEMDIAADITDRLSGVQSENGDSKTRREVLPGPGPAGAGAP